MTQPELPPGLSIDALRYIDPETYPIAMGLQGWQVMLQLGVDDNPAKIYLALERPLAGAIAIDEHWGLAQRMGITTDRDSSGYCPGYTLVQLMSHRGEQNLAFTFRGFPTAQTMHALTVLEAAFTPRATVRSPGRVSRIARKIIGI